MSVPARRKPTTMTSWPLVGIGIGEVGRTKSKEMMNRVETSNDDEKYTRKKRREEKNLFAIINQHEKIPI